VFDGGDRPGADRRRFFAHRGIALATQIITDGSTDRVREAPRVVLPDNPRLFEERAARFEQLAAGHSMGAYLGLMAQVCRGQQAAAGSRAAPPLPEAALEHSRSYGMPPLSAQGHARAPLWRDDLRDIVRTVRAGAAPGVQPTLARLQALDEASAEAIADRVLAGTTLDDDAALVPFVGAALQVYFTRQAAALAVADVSHCDVATVCPVCATRPVTSIIRIGGAQANLRYLVCALCQTEWNMTRAKCSSCETDKGVHFLSLAEDPDSDQAIRAVVKAEACDECKTYLKIVSQDQDAFADPYADDLATLALDVLVDEQGFARSGPNLLFHPGSG
jgi:FdhE protein